MNFLILKGRYVADVPLLIPRNLVLVMQGTLICLISLSLSHSLCLDATITAISTFTCPATVCLASSKGFGIIHAVNAGFASIVSPGTLSYSNHSTLTSHISSLIVGASGIIDCGTVSGAFPLILSLSHPLTSSS